MGLSTYLIADSLTFSGSHLTLIWEAFAGRGLGHGACDNWDVNSSQCNPHDPAGQVLEDFSLPPPGTIRGKVWEAEDCDLNPLGTLSGWVVYLDLNKNNSLDPGEPTDSTDASGQYEFSGLGLDSYWVGLEMQTGWNLVAPIPEFGPPTRIWRDPDPSIFYTDVWAVGDIALVGHSENKGVSIIDLTKIYQGHIDHALITRWADVDSSGQNTNTNTIKDVKAEGNIAFFASDNGGGVYIIDISNPMNPKKISQVTSQNGAFDKVHNVSIDDSFLYLASDLTSTVPIFDIRDPNIPVLLHTIDTNGGVVHDITALDDRLYVCDRETPGNPGVSGKIHIYDIARNAVGDFVSATFVTSFTAGDQTHSCWPTKNGDYLVVCKEDLTNSVEGNKVDIWRIDISPPQKKATITRHPNSATTAHNPVVEDDTLYISWYEAGYFSYDISNPEAPRFLGLVDTFPQGATAQTGVGCWGVYPFIDQGWTIATDTVFGLHANRSDTRHFVPNTQGGLHENHDFYVSQDCP